VSPRRYRRLHLLPAGTAGTSNLVRILLAVALVGVPLLTTAVASTAASAPASVPGTHQRRAPAVEIKVLDVTPSAPLPSRTKRVLTITLALTNTTAVALPKVTITGERGDPAGNQRALDAVLTGKTPPAGGIDIRTKRPVTVDLPAEGVAHQVTFTTDTNIPLDAGICLCQSAVYPLVFTARAADGGLALGRTVTFIPSFIKAPAPVRVSWVWPLIDRPHRLTESSVFTDDALSTDVGQGGRLDRALTVAESVSDRVPLTLVVDPELLDELAVMATGKYSVRSAAPGTRALPGVGQSAAIGWLQRFRSLLQNKPSVAVRLTPYADPDVQSLSLQDLPWRAAMPADMTARVTGVLAGRSLDYTLAWPAGGAYTAKTLGTLVERGVHQVLLPSTAVAPLDGAEGAVPVGTARLVRGGKAVAAALSTPAVQSDVTAVVSRGQEGAARLPQLIARVAIRAVEDPAAEHVLVMTPPRYVDADPEAANRAIIDTSYSPFARPISLAAALGQKRLPSRRSKLAAFPSAARTLPAPVVRSASDIMSALRTVNSMLAGGGTAAGALTAGLPVGLQRVETSYSLVQPGTGAAFADSLDKQIDALLSSVRIVSPSSGAYTLGSSNSPLPVTVENRLNYPVQVRLKVATVNGLPGFKLARDIGPQRILARSKRTVQLPTSIARSGRIEIEAQLLTPQKQSLGGPVSLSVHSTAFGALGVIITIVAGAVLALALLIRVLRRLRTRPRAHSAALPNRGAA